MTAENKTLIDNLIVSSEAMANKQAFRCDDSQITYSELLQQTLKLSAYLDTKDIGHQEPVALLMPRCLEYTFSAYGTMYGGRIFVPLDPALPVKVIGQLLVEHNIRVLITHQNLSHLINQLSQVPLTTLTTIIGLESIENPIADMISWNELFALPMKKIPSRATANDTAYVIHTSGSTGRPKGIVHTHTSASSFARVSMNAFGIESNDVIGSHGPLHTDMCTLGLLTGPLATATVEIIPEAQVRVPASLSLLIEKQEITIWYSVPQVIAQLLTRGVLDTRDLSHLRQVIYAGEALAPSRITELLHHVPNCRICNAYGPAETNVCTYYEISDRAELQTLVDESRPVPIGDVWPETSALLLDKNDKVIQLDAIGELVIHSSTMMSGYWEHNKNTSSVFYESSEDGRRYYRTGDLAKRDSSGAFTLLGRLGRQIKISGMRVELDSIELMLSQHSSVLDAAVVTQDTEDGLVKIHAVVTEKFQSETPELINVLYKHLRSRLPLHAIPESIQVRPSIPLTSGGKIDRLSLLKYSALAADNKQ